MIVGLLVAVVVLLNVMIADNKKAFYKMQQRAGTFESPHVSNDGLSRNVLFSKFYTSLCLAFVLMMNAPLMCPFGIFPFKK